MREAFVANAGYKSLCSAMSSFAFRIRRTRRLYIICDKVIVVIMNCVFWMCVEKFDMGFTFMRPLYVVGNGYRSLYLSILHKMSGILYI